MKPPPFTYMVVEEVDDAVSVLSERGDDAKVLAGGQSLIPLMNMRLAAPGALVDIGRISGLDTITANGVLEIGATVRQSTAERAPEVLSSAPMLAQALRHVAHPGVRARGTVGGSIAHADPAAEIPAVLLALGGEIVAVGPNGERTVKADDLFVTYFTTSLAPTELLTCVRIPRCSRDIRWGFLEVARRAGDFALVGVALAAWIDEGEVCRSARVVAFGVSDTPKRLEGAESALVGGRLSDQAVTDEAAAIATREIRPKSDFHASSEYRREVTGVLVRRALDQASSRGGRP